MQTLFDLVNRDDPEGRTYRQCNLAKAHAIPIGALVEINIPDEPESSGVRLFVVAYHRDCDGTPLYAMMHRMPHDDTGRTIRFIGTLGHQAFF